MRRGTTPTHEFTTDIDLSTADKIYITYKQGGVVKLEKALPDITVTPTKLIVTLTQEETLSFSINKGVEIQIRALLIGGEAIASNVITTTAQKILKEGVI